VLTILLEILLEILIKAIRSEVIVEPAPIACSHHTPTLPVEAPAA
jgi:hypothetical protein